MKEMYTNSSYSRILLLQLFNIICFLVYLSNASVRNFLKTMSKEINIGFCLISFMLSNRPLTCETYESIQIFTNLRKQLPFLHNNNKCCKMEFVSGKNHDLNRLCFYVQRISDIQGNWFDLCLHFVISMSFSK